MVIRKAMDRLPEYNKTIREMLPGFSRTDPPDTLFMEPREYRTTRGCWKAPPNVILSGEVVCRSEEPAFFCHSIKSNYPLTQNQQAARPAGCGFPLHSKPFTGGRRKGSEYRACAAACHPANLHLAGSGLEAGYLLRTPKNTEISAFYPLPRPGVRGQVVLSVRVGKLVPGSPGKGSQGF